MSSYEDFLRLSKLINNLSFTSSDGDSGRHIARQIVSRDKKYTELLESYTTITKVRFALKEFHKWVFFWLVIAACCCCLYLAYQLVSRILSVEDPQFIIDSVAVIFAAFTAFVSTVIAVPMAITKFLFNTNEDDNITQLIQHTQEHDASGMGMLKDKFSKHTTNESESSQSKTRSNLTEVSGDM